MNEITKLKALLKIIPESVIDTSKYTYYEFFFGKPINIYKGSYKIMRYDIAKGLIYGCGPLERMYRLFCVAFLIKNSMLSNEIFYKKLKLTVVKRKVTGRTNYVLCGDKPGICFFVEPAKLNESFSEFDCVIADLNCTG